LPETDEEGRVRVVDWSSTEIMVTTSTCGWPSAEYTSTAIPTGAPLIMTVKGTNGPKQPQTDGSPPKRERRRPLKPIEVSFGVSGRNEPLVTFVRSPLAFCDMELGPQQLRKIAATLLKIADDAEALGLNPGGKQRSYPIGE
jgi:hypothetical protein